MVTTAMVVALAAMPLLSQQAQDRGAIAIRRGADTLVVDRFIRQADTLEGSVQVKGQARIDYRALLGPNETVRSLAIAVFPAGSAPAAQPLQRLRVSMMGDTAVVETAAGTQRVPTRPGAIPSFNNALAISEFFTRRARLAGGSTTIPYFSLGGGATIDAILMTRDDAYARQVLQLAMASADPKTREYAEQFAALLPALKTRPAPVHLVPVSPRQATMPAPAPAPVEVTPQPDAAPTNRYVRSLR